MLLSAQDTELFYRLFGGLLVHINRQRQLVPGANSPAAYIDLPISDKMALRDVLWQEPEWIDTYLTANPDQLPEDELAIVRGWKDFVSGTFYISTFAP